MKITVLISLVVFACTSFSQNWREISIPTQVTNVAKKFLLADVYATDTTTAKPVILIQTPYNKVFYRVALANQSTTSGASVPYDSSKYNYVTVDWRGFYANKSADSVGYNRGLDGYDIVEWIATQKWCNGKIGTWGGSALGMIQFQTAAQHPPHLVCAAPFIIDFRTGYEDYFYGGDFRREHVQSLEKLGFLTVNTILSHPTYGLTWKFVEQQTDIADKIAIPVFMCSGWFDHFPDDVLRAFNDLRTKSDIAVRSRHKLLFGPWAHTSIGSSKQGILEYPGSDAIPTTLGMKFFDYYLRQEPNDWESQPTMRYYQMGENVWKTTDDWSTVALNTQTLYFHPGQTMDFNPPPPVKSLIPPDSVLAFPRNPVPSLGGARFNPFDQSVLSGPLDLTPLLSRNDVLTYTTDTLGSDIEINGSSQVVLSLTCDTKDADISARLCDIYPDGRCVILTQGILRLRFRASLSTEQLMTPNENQVVTIDLQNLAQTFLKGHRIGIVLSSGNYPMFDLNLNDGGAMYTSGDTTDTRLFLYHDYSNTSKFVFQSRSPLAGTDPEDVYAGTELHINPNPASDRVVASFSVAKACYTSVKIFDVLGHEINSLCSEVLSPGAYSFEIPFSTFSERVLFVRLCCGSDFSTRVLHKAY